MAKIRFRNPGDVYEYLLDFVNVEKGQKTEFKLDRMRELASSLGDPHLAYPVVHVAGSKGKGSVSIMMAKILESSGYRTGLYTSPHLVDWEERITLAGSPMPREIILESAGTIASLIDGKVAADYPGGELPTYFELTTLIGFFAFRLAGCTAAVIETGLGGRLDSTNIVDPAVSVITPIELEHTEFLGNSIRLIAGEKAGIIKPGRPVCISRQKAEAREVFLEVARRSGSTLVEPETIFGPLEWSLSRTGTRAVIRPRCEKASSHESFPWRSPLRCLGSGVEGSSALELGCPLVGSVQAENMSLSLAATCIVFPGIRENTVIDGLAHAFLPARFELCGRQPEVILDGAHTPSSVSIALESLKKLFGPRAILLFGCALDKKHDEMAELLAPHFESIFITRPGTFKQSDPEGIAASFSSRNGNTHLIPETKTAIRAAMDEAAGRGIPLLVTGSFYLCAEARAIAKN